MLGHPAGDAGCHGGGPSRVGAHPRGVKRWPTGEIHDLAGNVWEWCLDNYRPYSGKDEVDPLHLSVAEDQHVVRGGGWNRSAHGIRAAFRGGARYDYWVPGLGLRCVRNARDPSKPRTPRPPLKPPAVPSWVPDPDKRKAQPDGG